jgi:hypothetical protein
VLTTTGAQECIFVAVKDIHIQRVRLRNLRKSLFTEFYYIQIHRVLGLHIHRVQGILIHRFLGIYIYWFLGINIHRAL